MRSILLTTLLLCCLPALAWAQDSACIQCHGDADAIDEASAEIVRLFETDIHREVGLSCHDCHGGNPDIALADDMDASMDEGFQPNPFVARPERLEIPEYCGRCHSDPGYMRRFAPGTRVDQVAEYWTSGHGRALLNGDESVATCIDCHSVHGITRASVPQSPVYPKNVAETCSACHSSPEHMEGYERPDGSPMPVNQFALWEQSVHANALMNRGDLSAPTCNDCHGNHGAAPPGLASVGFVCGQCHGREAELFRASAKHAGIQSHREYLQEAGELGCAECHDVDGSEAGMQAPHGFAECSSCHGNHGIVRPTVAMLAPLPDSPCAFCHEQPAGIDVVAEPEKMQERYRVMKDALEATAAADGLEGAARFDWLTDRALELPTHTWTTAEGESSLRPEFARLFEKFRIGKTHYLYNDPKSGEVVEASITRCNSCHVGDDESDSKKTAETLVFKTRELTSLTAQAERMLLLAKRGGVETRGAVEALDQAVDSQIELEVLVHTFDSDGEFQAKHEEGMEHAHAALEASTLALEELDHRRYGLYIALVLSALVVLGLGLKIRRLAA